MDPLEDYPDYASGYAYQDRYVRDIDSIDSVGPRRSDNDNTGFLLHSTISRDEADGSKAPLQPTGSMDAPELPTPNRPSYREPLSPPLQPTRSMDAPILPTPKMPPYREPLPPPTRERDYHALTRRSQAYYSRPQRPYYGVPYTSRSPQFNDGYGENYRYDIPQAGYKDRYAPERARIPPMPRLNKGNKFAPPSSYGHQYEGDEEFPPDVRSSP